MLSALISSKRSYPALQLTPQQVHQRLVHHGPLVLMTDPLNLPTPTTDRDRTVSRRSEPSSRATLIGEQPNPWDLLQPQDVTSRHRGAKPPRTRYARLPIVLREPLEASVTLLEATTPVKLPTIHCPLHRQS